MTMNFTDGGRIHKTKDISWDDIAKVLWLHELKAKREKVRKQIDKEINKK